MSDQQFVAEAGFMKAMAHPTRLKILDLLRCGEKCVCDIYPAINLEQANVSRHLAVLKREGLLQSRKEGLKVIYSVPDNRTYEIIKLCSEMIRHMWLEKADLVR